MGWIWGARDWLSNVLDRLDPTTGSGQVADGLIIIVAGGAVAKASKLFGRIFS
jgi:hypothetical protein